MATDYENLKAERDKLRKELAEVTAERDTYRQMVFQVQALPVAGWLMFRADTGEAHVTITKPNDLFFKQALYAVPESIMDKTVLRLWRHVKSGGIYQIVGSFQIEATNRPGLLYKSVSTLVTWGRDQQEFLDGRFVRHEPQDSRPYVG